MLQQVQERLGPDYVCVRPDVLVEMRLHAAHANHVEQQIVGCVIRE